MNRRMEKMGKVLEPFAAMQTQHLGLWWHPEIAQFMSAAFNLAELKRFKGTVRVYMHKNRYFKEGTNRPNYTFCIRDSKSGAPQELEVVADEDGPWYDEEGGCYYDKDGERLFTREEVRRIMDGMVLAAEDGFDVFGMEPEYFVDRR